MKLTVQDELLAVCRLDPGDPWPGWLPVRGFLGLTRTADELSIICAEDWVPESVKCQRGWMAFKVDGPLDFSQIGVLAGLAQTLAEAKVSLLAISTYDTDYVLVREAQVEAARRALTAAGHDLA